MRPRRGKEPQIKISKQVPPLTLDQRWHTLFEKHKSQKMNALEHKLNALIKSLGQSNIDYKEYGQLKKKLLADILGDMPGTFDGNQTPSQGNMGKNKKYIDDINTKLKHIEDRLLKLPKEIEEANTQLLEESMHICYQRISKHKKTYDEMDNQVKKMRLEIKELILKKSESKEEYNSLYAFMHDLVGPEIIEQYDKLYLGGKSK